MNKEHSALVEEIREAISSGALSKEAIEARLTKAVEEESFQQDHPADAEFLNVCLDMLANLKTGGQFSFTPKVEEAKAAVTEKYEERVRFRGITRRIVKVACALVVVLGVGCLGVFAPRFGWLSARSTPDEQQYVVQGQSLDIGAVGHAGESAKIDTDVFVTTNLSEAVEKLGFQPRVVRQLSDKWSVKQCTVFLSGLADKLTVAYIDNNDKSMYTYEICRFHSIDDAITCFEQNQQGQLLKFDGSINLYYTENEGNQLYSWIEQDTICSVYSATTGENILEFVQELIKGVDK